MTLDMTLIYHEQEKKCDVRRNVLDVCVVQMMNHVAAARSSSLIFICVHREHYGFLETLAPHLEEKV